MQSLLLYILLGVFLTFLILSIIIAWSAPRKHRFSIKGKHAFITGGSKGIGLQLVAELLNRGARTVSIAARNSAALSDAKEYLRPLCGENQAIECYSLDVTAGYERIQETVRRAEEQSGCVDLLINNAGFVVQGGFDEIPVESFLEQMKINYLGGAHLTRAVITGMKKRECGHVCFVSSAAGQCAIWGYSSYSPSKFAVRGLADALHMELHPFGIGVSIVYPPNTDTEGFAVEQQEMPEEVKAISGTAGLFSAKRVAQKAIDNIESGGYASTMGFEGWMLGAVTAGASPEPGALSGISQMLFGGLFRGIMLVYLGSFNRVVREIHDRKIRGQ